MRLWRLTLFITTQQLVQNAAACLLTGKIRWNHVSPVLHSLQWLPAHNQIDFKMSVCWLLKLLMG